MDFSSAVIVGIPLVLVVLGLVEWIKQLGVHTQSCTESYNGNENKCWQW